MLVHLFGRRSLMRQQMITTPTVGSGLAFILRWSGQPDKPDEVGPEAVQNVGMVDEAKG